MSQEPSVEKQPPEILGSEEAPHERKRFVLELNENRRGRFLSITEDVAGRRADFADPSNACGATSALPHRLS